MELMGDGNGLRADQCSVDGRALEERGSSGSRSRCADGGLRATRSSRPTCGSRCRRELTQSGAERSPSCSARSVDIVQPDPVTLRRDRRVVFIGRPCAPPHAALRAATSGGQIGLRPDSRPPPACPIRPLGGQFLRFSSNPALDLTAQVAITRTPLSLVDASCECRPVPASDRDRDAALEREAVSGHASSERTGGRHGPA